MLRFVSAKVLPMYSATGLTSGIYNNTIFIILFGIILIILSLNLYQMIRIAGNT